MLEVKQERHEPMTRLEASRLTPWKQVRFGGHRDLRDASARKFTSRTMCTYSYQNHQSTIKQV